MENETAGDPITGLKWTRKTTEKIANELALVNINVGKTTVGNILKALGFSLKSNSKKISNGGKSTTIQEQSLRDEQFNYINKMRRSFARRSLPTGSVDTKKKELIGNFKNPGTRFKRESDLTNDHDFLTYALGKAVLYGFYDFQKNTGFVSVGRFLLEGNTISSSDTPEFAVESIARWWSHEGRKVYTNSSELLILADAGGSNGCHPHMWKVNLQKLLCNKYGLSVTVCHFPPGASKWNPIEHRLFSEITKNWRGTPLKDFETALKFTKTTETSTGLRVKAMLVKKKYKKGIKASQDDLNNLNIRYHKVNPKWNYTISPQA